VVPQSVQRADRRSRSLEASAPHLMIHGVNATGLRCRHRSQTNQNHGDPRRSCSSVGLGGLRFMPEGSPDLQRVESHDNLRVAGFRPPTFSRLGEDIAFGKDKTALE